MIRKKKYIGASGDYAKYELASIKALAKLLKQPYKKTLETVNLDNNLLKIISVNFDKKISIKETAKELKNALIKVAKKNPLESFVEILKKLPKKETENIKPKFPMKLPATVTIGKVKKRSRRINGTHTDNKSHNVKINVLSGILNPYLIKIENAINKYNNEIDLINEMLKDSRINQFTKNQLKNRKVYLIKEVKLLSNNLKKIK